MAKNLSKGIEIEGRTVNEAIEKAVKQLGLNKDQISVRIVSEEKRGLFGMEGAKPAKIIVTPKK